jgi:hypothetical protein
MKSFQIVTFALLSIFIITGCSNGLTRKDTWKNPAVISLANYNGEYILKNETGAGDFSGKLAFDSIIRQYDQKTIIDTLIKYMDDTAASKSVYQGKPVMTGVLCYEALSILIYYEPLDNNGDIALSWEGFVKPGSTTSELKAAKVAWEKVRKEKTYKVL